MPQINVFTYLSQTSWTIIIFILYYINMKQIIIPSIIEIIKLKNNSILILSGNSHSKNLASGLKNNYMLNSEYLKI